MLVKKAFADALAFGPHPVLHTHRSRTEALCITLQAVSLRVSRTARLAFFTPAILQQGPTEIMVLKQNCRSSVSERKNSNPVHITATQVLWHTVRHQNLVNNTSAQ